MRLRLTAAVLVCVLTAAIQLGTIQAHAGASFVASFTLDSSPSWQTASQRTSWGSWVKHSSPVVANLGDGPVILVGSQGGKLYALRYTGGKLVKLWDTGSAINTFIDSSPAVGDLNGDGCPEVVVGAGNEFHPQNSGVHVFDCHGRNHRFWPAPVGPRPNHVGVFSTPAIGDINGDGRPDVVYGSFNQKIYAKDANGRDLPGWPHENYDTIWSSPALADLNGDRAKEVITGTDLGGGAPVFGCSRGIRGTISVFNGSAGFVPNFPKCMDTPIWSTPAVQDINRDGTLDIVVGTNNYTENGGNVGQPWKVRAYDSRSGRLEWETPLRAGFRIFSSPAIGDVGADGSLDVAISMVPAGGEVYLLDARTGRIKWHRGSGQACACGYISSPVIADVNGDGKPEVVATAQDGSVSAWDAAGNAVINRLVPPRDLVNPKPGQDSYGFFNSPAVADLNGDGKNEIVVASAIRNSNPLTGKVWVIETGGRGQGPWPFFKRTVDRLSSTGTGKASASSALAPTPQPVTHALPAPTHQRSTAQPSTTEPATPTPTAVPTTVPPTEGPQALPTEPPSSRNPALPIAVGLVGAVLFGGTGALLLRRRKS